MDVATISTITKGSMSFKFHSYSNKHQGWVLTSCLVYLTAGSVLNPSSTLSFMLKWIRALHILQICMSPLSFSSSHHYKAIWIEHFLNFIDE